MRARAAEASGLAVVLAAAGILYARSLHDAANYDEGVYLASLRALEAGERLGGDVFASQPPGFYWLLRLFGAVFGDDLVGVRSGFLALALLGLLAAWSLGRRLAGPVGGIAAAGLLAVAPPYPTEAVRIEADTASTVLALASIAAVAYATRRERSTALAALGGALLGLAVLVKLSAVTALVPLAALALVLRLDRREALAWLGGAALPFAAAAVAHRASLPEIWHGAVGFHTGARDLPVPGTGANARRVARFFDLHTPFGVLAPLGLLATMVPLLRRRVLPLWTWPAAAALFLVAQRPLLDHHLVLLAVAVAVPAGMALGAVTAQRPVLLAALALALAAGYVQETRRLDRNSAAEPDEIAWAASRLREQTPAGATVATDLPIVAVLADRLVPGMLVDTSYVRVESGDLTVNDFVDEVERSRPAAVVLGRELARPSVERTLGARYPRREQRGGVTILLPPAGGS